MPAERRRESGCHVVIVGAMGSGKTTLGKGLARALGRQFRDSDLSIQALTGSTGREMAAELGVAALHQLEKEVLLEALIDPEPAVVAAAASTIEHEEVRDALEDVYCVWVTAPAEVLAERSARGSHRRRVAPEEHLERRDRLFAESADLVVDTGQLSPEDAVEKVIARLGMPRP